MTLAEQVLDKLAKELAEEYGTYKNWKEMTKGNYWACAEPVVERAVVLALLAKQAEVDKNINEAIKRYGTWTENLGDSIEQGDYWIREFDLKKFLKEKRLLVKAVEKK